MSCIDHMLEKHFAIILSNVIETQIQSGNPLGIAVAYSGGLDSSVLLNIAIEFGRSRNIPVFAFHVHHGLSANADAWLEHCRSFCEQSGIGFSAKKIHIFKGNKDGIESSARTERYRALGELCVEHNMPIVLTGHHQDDQAETLLLQLLRGSGVSGLSGMDTYNRAPTLLGTNNVLLVRPILDITKQILTDFAVKNAIAFVDDESNFDHRYARNALRHKVMPVLSAISQGYTARLARSAQHVQTAGRLLIELAKIDIAEAMSDGALDIQVMRLLSVDRIDNLLRYWLSSLGVRMPSTARLADIRNQIFDARHDAQVTICHDQLEIHRYKNKVYAASIPITRKISVTPKKFVWSGEHEISFPEFNGTLYFDRSDYGVAETWLKSQIMTLKTREGGERLKLAPNRPTRDIKSHFQTLKIPFWQRKILPFIYVDEELLYAANVGIQATFCEMPSSVFISFRWVFDDI